MVLDSFWQLLHNNLSQVVHTTMMLQFGQQCIINESGNQQTMEELWSSISNTRLWAQSSQDSEMDTSRNLGVSRPAEFWAELQNLLFCRGNERSVEFEFFCGNCPVSRNTLQTDVHCVSKKGPTCKLSVTLSNLSRFSKLLHCWKAYKIRYKNNTTLPTSP